MSRIKESLGSRIFDVCNVCFFVLIGFVMIFPFWNVLTTSIVGIGEFYARPLILWPKDPTLIAYKFIFSSDKMTRTFAVTTFVTVVGTIYNVIVTSCMSYSLSKKYLPGRNIFLIILTITMFFSGGLIPYYLLIKSLGLMNTIWVLIIPTGVSVWDFVVMKSFFSQLPVSLEESAKLDGANDIVILFKIIFPLSLPLLATFALFNAVGIWNAWFDAMLFIQDRKLHPLQLVLRQMLVDNNLPAEMQTKFIQQDKGTLLFDEGLKMATVVVATIPILCIYPWLQKYFEKGVMVGSVKG